MTSKEFYAKRKKAHVCVQCGEQDAYTLNGRARCAVCAEKNLAGKKTKEANEKSCARMKELYKRRAEQGVCTHCGGKVDDGYITCKRCRIRGSNMIREKNIENGANWPRGSNGICYVCNKEHVLDGYKVCKSCYDKLMETTKDRIERFGSKGPGSVKKWIDEFWRLKKAGAV